MAERGLHSNPKLPSFLMRLPRLTLPSFGRSHQQSNRDGVSAGQPRRGKLHCLLSFNHRSRSIARRFLRELADTLAQRRFATVLLGIFAALALGLAAVGIYGVTSYSVTLRTQEVGVRMALGARADDVLRLLVGQALWLTLTGVGIGLVLSVALTWVIAGMLYGVTARDPLTLLAASATLVGVAMIACYVPARRASRLDPMVALRVE